LKTETRTAGNCDTAEEAPVPGTN